MPEVLTDPCQKIDIQKFSETNFLICGGGGAVVPRSQAAEHSTQNELHFDLLLCNWYSAKIFLLMYNTHI